MTATLDRGRLRPALSRLALSRLVQSYPALSRLARPRFAQHRLALGIGALLLFLVWGLLAGWAPSAPSPSGFDGGGKWSGYMQ